MLGSIGKVCRWWLRNDSTVSIEYILIMLHASYSKPMANEKLKAFHKHREGKKVRFELVGSCWGGLKTQHIQQRESIFDSLCRFCVLCAFDTHLLYSLVRFRASLSCDSSPNIPEMIFSLVVSDFLQWISTFSSALFSSDLKPSALPASMFCLRKLWKHEKRNFPLVCRVSLAFSLRYFILSSRSEKPLLLFSGWFIRTTWVVGRMWRRCGRGFEWRIRTNNNANEPNSNRDELRWDERKVASSIREILSSETCRRWNMKRGKDLGVTKRKK